MTGRLGNLHKAWPYPHYVCTRKYREKHIYNCQERYISANNADALVWVWLSDLFKNPDRMRVGLREYAEHQSADLQTKLERLEVVEDLIGQSDKRIKRLVRFARTAGDDEVAEEYHAQAREEGRTKAELTRERDILTAELAEVEMSEEKQAMILAWADEIREGLEAGDVDFGAKRRMVDMLDVQVKVEYREGVRGLFMRCVLRYADKWMPLPFGTSSSTTSCPFFSRRERALRWAAASGPI